MDLKEQQQKTQQKTQWASCDPFTLVSAVREGVYEIPENHRSKIEGPFEELASRFDQQARAALGGSTGSLVTQQPGS